MLARGEHATQIIILHTFNFIWSYAFLLLLLICWCWRTEWRKSSAEHLRDARTLLLHPLASLPARKQTVRAPTWTLVLTTPAAQQVRQSHCPASARRKSLRSPSQSSFRSCALGAYIGRLARRWGAHRTSHEPSTSTSHARYQPAAHGLTQEMRSFRQLIVLKPATCRRLRVWATHGSLRSFFHVSQSTASLPVSIPLCHLAHR